jgi:hypothetical protein
MIRVGRLYLPDEILPLVVFGKPRSAADKAMSRRKLDEHIVNFGSLRLQVFAMAWTVDGLRCAACSTRADRFYKEFSSEQDGSPHLNLYGTDADGREVLFTKDHRMPKSWGGSEHLTNFRTMCKACNTAKGADSCHALTCYGCPHAGASLSPGSCQYPR